MKKLIAICILTIMTLSSAYAGEVDLKSYTDDELAALESAIAQEKEERGTGETTSESEEEIPAFQVLQNGERNGNVAPLQQKLIELGFLNGAADGIFGTQTENALKELQKAINEEPSGVIDNQEAYDFIMNLSKSDGENIAIGTSSEWSAWMTPEENKENQCFTVAYAYPGEKQVGDVYTCQVEIEFAVVKESGNGEDQKFGFRAQGSVDDAWDVGNIWNGDLININRAPEDGIYKYSSISVITDKIVDKERFDLGFRCDYWANGSFRVRNVKVEKGIPGTEWTLAKSDISDGKNIAIETSGEWSEWMTPAPNQENVGFTVSHANLGEKRVGELYTCQVEIEFLDVTATKNQDDKKFRFLSQGAVDGKWDIGNIWNGSLVWLDSVPENGVYTYTATSKISKNNVNGSVFDLGFRCDYWAGGQFRVRSVKVEKGISATP